MLGTTQLESAGYSGVRWLRAACFWCGRKHHAEHPLSVCRTCAAGFRITDGEAFAVFYAGRSDVDLRGRLHEWVGMPNPETRMGSFAKAPWCVQRRGPLPVDAPKFGRVVHGDGSYTRFAFSYAADATAAFEQECRNYDDFGGSNQLDNDGPPAEPPHRAVRSASAGRER